MTQRHPLRVYTAQRIVLFAVPFLVLWAIGLDVVWALLIAAIGSSIASIFVLNRSRDALSASLASRADRAKARMAERTRSEDEWDDAERAKSEPTDGAAADSSSERDVS